MSTYFDDQESPAPDASSKPTEGQAPLLLQELQTPEEAFGLPKARRTSQQAVVVVMLVAGAIAAIFAMRQFGMGPSATLADISLEYRPETQTETASPGKILLQLARSRTAVQVPADHITQDPFELSALPETSGISEAERLAQKRLEEEAQRVAAARKAALEKALNGMQLQSVMQGRIPVAMISGEMCRVGSPVGDLFTVESIHERSVVVITEGGDRHTLTLDDKPGQPTGRRRN